MTAAIIRAAIEAEFTRSPAPPTTDDIAAAVLRAAADQVLPEEPLHGGDLGWMFERDARQERRKKLLAIAAELEGATPGSSTH